ncbi:MAG: carboxylesterase/lipase family protein [Eubacterium sp.]|nr:carboxylesterase/lipase family protein [Eubacterium sp.]
MNKLDCLVETEYGKVRGKGYDGGVCFFGIPYAKATVGIRRFLPPEAPNHYRGIFNAFQQPKSPIQGKYNSKTQSEDSLRLNIWVPDTQEDKPLAVMFWIYGGSYATGGVRESFYDMSAMANDTGCIIVTVNYRLNVCGFLDLRDIVPGATANNGLRDIVFALKWVNENIANFGGDPSNVTVFGQSAGAVLSVLLFAVPSAKGYFSRVISQSCCGDSVHSPKQAKELTKTWLEIMGDPTAIDLINMSPKQLLSGGNRLWLEMAAKAGIDCTFNPVIDGEFLTCHPSRLPAEEIDKKLMIGYMKEETEPPLFFLRGAITKLPIIQNLVTPNYPEALKQSLTEGIAYPGKDAFITLSAERVYRYPIITLADHFSKYTDVYSYRFDYVPAIIKPLDVGVIHATEIPILFDKGIEIGNAYVKITNSETAFQIGRRMREWWGNFAKYGCPDEKWEKYDPENRATKIINEKDHMEHDPYGERMKLYESYVSPWAR